MCVFQSSKEAIIHGYTEGIDAKLTYKDAAEALQFIVKENWNEPDFVKNSCLTTDTSGQRVYSTPETGDWWIDIEVTYLILSFSGFYIFMLYHLQKSRLRIDTGNNEAVVLGVILYSDSTTVTQNGRDSLWPIYMTLANIPIHRRNRPGAFQLLGFMPYFDGHF